MCTTQQQILSVILRSNQSQKLKENVNRRKQSKKTQKANKKHFKNNDIFTEKGIKWETTIRFHSEKNSQPTIIQ